MADRIRATLFRYYRQIVILGALWMGMMLLFQPMMLLWRDMSDYQVHNQLAQQVLDEPQVFFQNTPHFLYHVSAAMLYRSLPIETVPRAAAWVMVLSYIATASILYYWLWRCSDMTDHWLRLGIIALSSLGLMIIAPIFFDPNNLYFGYFTPHVYHNPTMNMMKPFSLALFLLGSQLFLRRDALANHWLILFILCTFLSITAKPNFIIAFIPALALMVALVMMMHWRDLLVIVQKPWLFLRALLGRLPAEKSQSTVPQLLQARTIQWMLLCWGIVLPALLILVYQSMTWTQAGGIGVDPLRVVDLWAYHFEPQANQHLIVKWMLSYAFPLAVYLLHVRAAFKDVGFNLAWLLTLIAMLYYYLFIDLTKPDAGDFAWSSQIAVFITHVCAMAFLLRYYGQGLSWSLRQKVIFSVCYTLFLVHVVAGIYWYHLHATQDAIALLYGAW